MNASTIIVFSGILYLFIMGIRHILHHGLCEACEYHGNCRRKKSECSIYEKYMKDNHPEKLSRG